MNDRIQLLDFTELNRLDRPGFGLHALTAEIGRRLSYNVHVGGSGSDNGRDLVFEVNCDILFDKKKNMRWLVSCKDFARDGRNVTAKDIQNLRERVDQHKCDGFLLVTTTGVTDDLSRILHSYEQDKKFYAEVWNKHDLSRILLDNPKLFRSTLARFFPRSHKHVGPLPDRMLELLMTTFERAHDANEMSLESLPETIEEALQIMTSINDDELEWEFFAWIIFAYEPPLKLIKPFTAKILSSRSKRALEEFTDAVFISLSENLCREFEARIEEALIENVRPPMEIGVMVDAADPMRIIDDEIEMRVSGYGDLEAEGYESESFDFAGTITFSRNGYQTKLHTLIFDKPSKLKDRISSEHTILFP